MEGETKTAYEIKADASLGFQVRRDTERENWIKRWAAVRWGDRPGGDHEAAAPARDWPRMGVSRATAGREWAGKRVVRMLGILP